MRTFDPAPLYRATIGFDQMADLMDRLLTNEAPDSGYPPYNIEKVDENEYRISLAVAGFAADEINVETKQNQLLVSARKAEEDAQRTYLHRGIAQRAFERRFHLADHVHVSGARHVDGMLHIDLVREVPEALKPRTIEITRGNTTPTDRQVEGTAVRQGEDRKTAA